MLVHDVLLPCKHFNFTILVKLVILANGLCPSTFQVVKVDHDLGRINSLSEETTYGLVPLESKPGQDDSRRKAFWRELQAMRRLRSPHTVQLYGAITSCDDHLVLVMELLPGGDLRTLLKDALEPLDEPHARRIIGDVCAGMAFLHQKEMIHGDLKSPNVLFDGFGRAKVGRDLRYFQAQTAMFPCSVRAKPLTKHAHALDDKGVWRRAQL